MSRLWANLITVFPEIRPPSSAGRTDYDTWMLLWRTSRYHMEVEVSLGGESHEWFFKDLQTLELAHAEDLPIEEVTPVANLLNRYFRSGRG